MARPEIPVSETGKRQTIRVAVALRIVVRFDTISDVVNSRTLNISRGGAFVHTPKPRPPGTRVQIQLTIGDRVLELGGRVAHSVSVNDPAGRDPGMGVRFDDLAPDVAAALDQLVAGDE